MIYGNVVMIGGSSEDGDNDGYDWWRQWIW